MQLKEISTDYDFRKTSLLSGKYHINSDFTLFKNEYFNFAHTVTVLKKLLFTYLKVCQMKCHSSIKQNNIVLEFCQQFASH